MKWYDTVGCVIIVFILMGMGWVQRMSEERGREERKEEQTPCVEVIEGVFVCTKGIEEKYRGVLHDGEQQDIQPPE